MPRINREGLTPSNLFAAMHGESVAREERNDCTVKALAAACGISYDVAHEALARSGRKPRRGSFLVARHFHMFGKNLLPVDPRNKINQYPKAHRKLKHVTSYHPRRFPNVWKDGKTYIARSHRHVFAIIDGVTHDWSHCRALRVVQLFEVVDL